MREDWLQPWLHLKLGMVFLLFLYHLKCGQIYTQLQNNVIKWTSTKLRFWNEVATLFLISIVFIVVMKHMLNWIWGVVGIMGIAVAITIAVKWYKKRRDSDQ
ncbi:MAG: CopD family protein [Flavobacteriales bacterium]|nr:CopD family protein [Flavobacteriales bacterium]